MRGSAAALAIGTLAVTAASGRPDGATFWIYDRGTHAVEVATTERATFTRQWATTRTVGGH